MLIRSKGTTLSTIPAFQLKTINTVTRMTNSIGLTRILIVLTFVFFHIKASAQLTKEQKQVLKGTWVRVDGEADTLKMYMDGNGVDFALVGVKPENYHGYYLQLSGQQARIEAMCNGKVVEGYFNYSEEDKLLVIQDFYGSTSERLKFRKISDKLW